MLQIHHLLLILAIAALAIPSTYAFGAGEIPGALIDQISSLPSPPMYRSLQPFPSYHRPDYAYLNDKAFRHGDIENILKEMYKIVSSHHGLSFGGGAMGILSGISGALGSGRGTKVIGALVTFRV